MTRYTQPQLRHGTTNVSVDDEKLTPAELVRLGRLARELRLTDQILSIDLDTLSIVETGPAPAWTALEGDHISFAMDKMPFPKGAIEVAVWLGTNAHELGHSMYSPRRHSPLMQQLIDADKYTMQGLAQLHNILEDQRQERLILGRFAPWRAFLVAALGHHLVVNDESAWLLLCGRTWLPATIRDQAKARFVVAYNQTIADEVAVIVGNYQRLIDPGFAEYNEAWALLEQLYNLLPRMPHMPQGTCAVLVGGEPDTDPTLSDDAPSTADEAEDEATGQGSSDQDSEDDTSDEGNDQAEAGGQGAGGKVEPPKEVTSKDVRKALKQAANKQLEEDKDASDELDSILDALRNGRNAGGDTEGDMPDGHYGEATDSARSLAHEVSDALLDLKDASEPGWVKRTDSGRLNIRRLINPNIGPDEWFDRYEPGQLDASELEAFLLLDVSGSMIGSTFALSEATWAIRHAVDDLEGSCTVVTFSSGHRVLSASSDRPDDRMFVLEPWGGTQPKESLEAAYRAMVESQARNRLVVILTDGGWWNGSGKNSNDKIIAAMRAAGMTTIIALYGDGSGEDAHGCEFAGSIDDPLELARLFKRVAADRIGKWQD